MLRSPESGWCRWEVISADRPDVLNACRREGRRGPASVRLSRPGHVLVATSPRRVTPDPDRRLRRIQRSSSWRPDSAVSNRESMSARLAVPRRGNNPVHLPFDGTGSRRRQRCGAGTGARTWHRRSLVLPLRARHENTAVVGKHIHRVVREKEARSPRLVPEAVTSQTIEESHLKRGGCR